MALKNGMIDRHATAVERKLVKQGAARLARRMARLDPENAPRRVTAGWAS